MSISKDIRTDLNSNIWGPSGWFFLDSVCLSYPNKPTNIEKKYYKNFFNSFPYILPCEKCRCHFNKYLKSNPLDENILKSKDNLVEWFLKAHNNVNKINDKKKISLEEMFFYYNNKYNMDVKKDTCKVTCGLQQNNLSNDSKKDNYDYKIISIILFGIIIALSLFLIRSYQN